MNRQKSFSRCCAHGVVRELASRAQRDAAIVDTDVLSMFFKGGHTIVCFSRARRRPPARNLVHDTRGTGALAAGAFLGAIAEDRARRAPAHYTVLPVDRELCAFGLRSLSMQSDREDRFRLRTPGSRRVHSTTAFPWLRATAMTIRWYRALLYSLSKLHRRRSLSVAAQYGSRF